MNGKVKLAIINIDELFNKKDGLARYYKRPLSQRKERDLEGVNFQTEYALSKFHVLLSHSFKSLDTIKEEVVGGSGYVDIDTLKTSVFDKSVSQALSDALGIKKSKVSNLGIQD